MVSVVEPLPLCQDYRAHLVVNKFFTNIISAEDRVIRMRFCLTHKERQRHGLNFRFLNMFLLKLYWMESPESDPQVQVKTELGDSVYVTGSIVELGCWDHRNGLQLSTNASTYPMWTGSHMIPSGALCVFAWQTA